MSGHTKICECGGTATCVIGDYYTCPVCDAKPEGLGSVTITTVGEPAIGVGDIFLLSSKLPIFVWKFEEYEGATDDQINAVAHAFGYKDDGLVEVVCPTVHTAIGEDLDAIGVAWGIRRYTWTDAMLRNAIIETMDYYETVSGLKAPDKAPVS